MDNKSITYQLDTVLQFGKHKGKTIGVIMIEDPTYLYWMYDKGFKLSNIVRKASNVHTKARMREAGVEVHPSVRVAKAKGYIGYGEQSILNDLSTHLDNIGFHKYGIDGSEEDYSLPDLK